MPIFCTFKMWNWIWYYQLASLDLSERDERMIWHLRILDTTANCKNPSQLLLHTHLFYNYPLTLLLEESNSLKCFAHTHMVWLSSTPPLSSHARVNLQFFFLLLLKNFSKWGIFHLVVHPTFSKQTVNETFTAFSNKIRISKICVLSLPKKDFSFGLGRSVFKKKCKCIMLIICISLSFEVKWSGRGLN